ncbi:DivIVA domain-containing protein [Lysinibacter sp. HNR]|uniref:DivIVA domain-containing protein n=1 Tax=Lysinibacter sp. HNR TaxID=3031408 RepID=UPI00243500D0|nr:DivIVA domain-containing protein [Lysinibacter sp. HNR]WGD38429.1 DivIVA domain-containing protein [Lysinibacter sp. HNR]
MSTTFPRSKNKKQAYNAAQVDAFLAEAREAYNQDAAGKVSVTAADLRRISFSLQRGGYSARHVDAALDRLEEVFFEREKQSILRDGGQEEWDAMVQQKIEDVRSRLIRPKKSRFSRSGLFANGYNRSQVDALSDRVAAYLDEGVPLTLTEVRDATFFPEKRGYREDQVDFFLDYVIDIILSVR